MIISSKFNLLAKKFFKKVNEKKPRLNKILNEI